MTSERDDPKEINVKKPAASKTDSGELLAEYDLTKLGPGAPGKYYQRAKAGTNLVLIEPDLAKLFPDGESVNRALRLLADIARGCNSPTASS